MQHREHAVTAGGFLATTVILMLTTIQGAHPENRHLGGVSGGY